MKQNPTADCKTIAGQIEMRFTGLIHANTQMIDHPVAGGVIANGYFACTESWALAVLQVTPRLQLLHQQEQIVVSPFHPVGCQKVM